MALLNISMISSALTLLFDSIDMPFSNSAIHKY